jgi:hypothetical protein
MYPAAAVEWLVKATECCEQAGLLVLKLATGAGKIATVCEIVFWQPDKLVMVRVTT